MKLTKRVQQEFLFGRAQIEALAGLLDKIESPVALVG